jgi:hypothetical protein
MTGYINAYHHNSPHAGEYSFNADANSFFYCRKSREEADAAAAWEMSVEPCTRRVGVWRVKAKDA